jgi:hypothetical protein
MTWSAALPGRGCAGDGPAGGRGRPAASDKGLAGPLAAAAAAIAAALSVPAVGARPGAPPGCAFTDDAIVERSRLDAAAAVAGAATAAGDGGRSAPGGPGPSRPSPVRGVAGALRVPPGSGDAAPDLLLPPGGRGAKGRGDCEVRL